MNLKTAGRDAKYLLDRGYKKTMALNFVANHYRLSKRDRNFLVRCVFSEKEIRSHKAKLIPPGKLAGKNLVVDTYNVLITVQEILSGREVVKGMDGILRDTSAVFSKNTDSMRIRRMQLKSFLKSYQIASRDLSFSFLIRKSLAAGNLHLI